jgi:hypothetical protein
MRPATPPPVQLDASGRPVGGRTLSLSPVPFMHGSRASSPTPPIRSSSPSNLPPSGGGGSSRGGGGGGGGGHLEAKVRARGDFHTINTWIHMLTHMHPHDIVGMQLGVLVRRLPGYCPSQKALTSAGPGNQVKALQAELDEANASNKIKDAQIETAEHRCAAAVGERDSARRQLAEQQVGFRDRSWESHCRQRDGGRVLPCFSCRAVQRSLAYFALHLGFSRDKVWALAFGYGLRDWVLKGVRSAYCSPGVEGKILHFASMVFGIETLRDLKMRHASG